MSRSDHGRRVIVRRAGEGHAIPGPEGVTIKASSAETGGAVGFMEATTPSGFGPPRHIHHTCDELFYVLEGEFQFMLGDRVETAGPGSFVFVPRGTVHAPKVVGEGPGRVLVAFVPGGQEMAFEDFAKLFAAHGDGSQPSLGEQQAIAAKYDSEFVGPPL